jgi:RNA polymerase sigma-70 factor, ECF subfamily
MTSRSGLSSTHPDDALAAVFRAEWGRLLSLLVARTRRLDLAEDALGEAFSRAAQLWPSTGVPDNPAAWLHTTARRQVIGRIRAEAVAGRKAPLLAMRPGWAPPSDTGDGMPDDRLDLIVLCCHPALPIESRSALALRLVMGTPTDEIARLFLVPVPTMAARITRAKKKIVAAGIPLGAPVDEELRRRLDEVCRTVYLAFTAGYTPGDGPDLLRADVATDAVELSGVLRDVAPDAPQVRALHPLLVLQHSRRDARQHDGRLVTLAEQDRSLWHRDEIDAGLDDVFALEPSTGLAEELRLQALIAAEHARAATASATDWSAIAGHYERLEVLTGSPIVRLNRAVAIAEVDGPAAGLDLLDDLDDLLAAHHRLHAVRGDLAQRAGQSVAAAAAFARAVELCANEVEREHLTRRLVGLNATG